MRANRNTVQLSNLNVWERCFSGAGTGTDAGISEARIDI
jgi:hypothetical protein